MDVEDPEEHFSMAIWTVNELRQNRTSNCLQWPSNMASWLANSHRKSVKAFCMVYSNRSVALEMVLLPKLFWITVRKGCYFIFHWYNSYLHRVPPSDSFLLIILMICTELHRVAPSCTEYHRVTLFLIDILLTCTEYHRVTHFCLIYLWFAPSTTELHRVAPSTTELLYFCFIYFLLVHRVPPSCTEFHRVPPSYFMKKIIMDYYLLH